MRRGIFKDEDGVRTFDVQKIVGKGFSNGWFTNFKGRYRIFCGARNTGKSKRFIGYETIMKIMSDPRRNIVVCRQDYTNCRQSVFANITRCISDLGLEEFFKSKQDPLEITYIPTGQRIVFRGLNQPTSITSIEFSTGFLTDVYIEEAYEVPSFEPFEMLDGSIRAGVDYDEDGNIVESDVPLQITLLLNPWSENWIYQEFFRGKLEDDYEYLESHKYAEYINEEYQGNHGKGLYLHKSTYKCNNFRDKKSVDPAAERMKSVNPDLYKVVYLGMWGATGQVTYPEFTDKNYKTINELLSIPLCSYSIGIDAGFSNGEGKKVVVKKGEDPEARVRSATTMVLTGFSVGYEKIMIYDEYYHTNIASKGYLNTDKPEPMTMPELAGALIQQIITWKNKYSNYIANGRRTMLLKGNIEVFVDNADVGFIQTLQMKAREFGLYNADFIPSTKSPINGRVLFEKAMLSYGDLMIEKDNCKNLAREFKTARGGEKGEIRTDENDHVLTAMEYAIAPYRNSFVTWKQNFKDQ